MSKKYEEFLDPAPHWNWGKVDSWLPGQYFPQTTNKERKEIIADVYKLADTVLTAKIKEEPFKFLQVSFNLYTKKNWVGFTN